jgi:hypothetical protein
MKRFPLCRTCLAFVIALVVLASAGGCGDDSEGDANGADITVETGSLSKAQFIDRVDSICKEVRRKFNREFIAFAARVEANASETESQGRAKLIRTILIPAYEDLIQQVSDLGAPSGDETRVSEFLDSMQGTLDEADADPQGFFATSNPFRNPAKLAVAYGLTGCARSLV